MFFTFSIGFQTSWLTPGEMIDWLAFFYFITLHILVIWNNKKGNFSLRSLFSDPNWSDNLLLTYLRNIWTKKTAKKESKQKVGFLMVGLKFTQDSKQWSMLLKRIFLSRIMQCFLMKWVAIFKPPFLSGANFVNFKLVSWLAPLAKFNRIFSETLSFTALIHSGCTPPHLIQIRLFLNCSGKK